MATRAPSRASSRDDAPRRHPRVIASARARRGRPRERERGGRGIPRHELNQEVAVVAVVGTSLVRDAATRHRTAPTATAALGRSLMCSLLLGTFKGEDETTQLTFKGDGPLGQIIATSTHDGRAKGLVSNPNADPPLRKDGKLNVGGAVGSGVLTVSRAHPSMKTPFTGTVELASGEIAEDVAKYLLESEQVGSAIAVGVSIDRECEVIAAGGFMVQILPFASDETISALEKPLHLYLRARTSCKTA